MKIRGRLIGSLVIFAVALVSINLAFVLKLLPECVCKVRGRRNFLEVGDQGANPFETSSLQLQSRGIPHNGCDPTMVSL